MKTNLLLSALLFTTAASAEKVRLTDCPEAVQQTIRQNQRDGRVDEVKTTLVDQKTIYVAEVELAGDRDLEIHVANDGALLKTREEITLQGLPEPVKKAADKLANEKGGKLEDPKKVIESGATTYKLEIDRHDGPDWKVTFASDGKILSEKVKSD